MEQQTYMDELAKFMLTPASCGLYLSRADLLKLANIMNATVGITDRKFIFKDIMKFIDGESDMIRFVQLLIEMVMEQEQCYSHYQHEYPHSQELYEEHRRKLVASKQYLESIIHEVSLS